MARNFADRLLVDGGKLKRMNEIVSIDAEEELYKATLVPEAPAQVPGEREYPDAMVGGMGEEEVDDRSEREEMLLNKIQKLENLFNHFIGENI